MSYFCINMNTTYLDELNNSQRDAVLYCDGPSLVIAGAGSGKTRVLTYKIAYLLENGYMPYNILALTFTNKAAREMKERIAKQVGSPLARMLWMGTFHSIFSRILRAQSLKIDFSSNFTIYDTSDSKSLIRSIIKELQLDEKKYKPGLVQGRISKAKNHLIMPDAYASNAEIYKEDMSLNIPMMRDIYRRYWERCKQADAMDFDDLLLYTYVLFKQNPEVLRHYQEQFKYVLVDEYQDTNYAQHAIVMQLTSLNQRVCVVGDDAQSIYSFRGADIDNILSFSKLYPETRLFKLEQNYRSTQSIVMAANSLIEKNLQQIKKSVYSKKDEGEIICVSEAYSDVEEGEIVANKIAALRREGNAFSDFAVLYRTNAQSRIFEEAFRKRAFPYRIYGGLSFYQRKEVKDVIAYFRLVVNPNDEEAFKRIINYPARGIGDTTVGKIAQAATTNGVSFWTVISEPLTYGLSINKGTHAKIQAFYELIQSFRSKLQTSNAYEMGVEVVRQSGIINEICQDNTPENISRKENVEELVSGLNDFCATRREEDNPNTSLSDFLSEVSLLTDQDETGGEDEAKITLMTIHASKGLEFKNVFVVGLEENLFPSNMSGDSPRAMEEERRLFYVAITRAEEKCFLSFAKMRLRYGKTEFGTPSRFLRDIDSTLISLPKDSALRSKVDNNARGFSTVNRTVINKGMTSSGQRLRSMQSATVAPANQTSSSSSATTPPPMMSEGIGGIAVGKAVAHDRFGKGKVISIEGVGENAKAHIQFENSGTKQLLLRFARLTVID